MFKKLTILFHSDKFKVDFVEPCGNRINIRLILESSGGGLHLQEVHRAKAAASSPLQHLQPMHPQDGPSLPYPIEQKSFALLYLNFFNLLSLRKSSEENNYNIEW